MNKADGVENRVALYLKVAVGAILLLTVLAVIFAGEFVGENETIRPIEFVLPDPSQVSQSGVSDYQAAIDSPLFWQKRTPNPISGSGDGDSPKDEARDAGQIRFLGNIKSQVYNKVLLGDGSSVQILEKGELIQGWVVSRIGNGEVVLEKNGRKLKLPEKVDYSKTIELKPDSNEPANVTKISRKVRSSSKNIRKKIQDKMNVKPTP